jgi:Fic family protein
LNRLHRSWEEFSSSLDTSYQLSLRRRTLRRHAIETGIIERLYQIEWGVTETLVAEGLTREAIARSGGELSEGVLDMIAAQLDGLNMVTEYVQQDYPLTTSFIKELHALITRAQSFYDATDALGRPVRARLIHGKFKTLPNNVKLADGYLLTFAPPEQVNGEMERLVRWYNEMGEVHPVIAASWLHHRFVQIHPFQDGNGRVARALTLLSLGRKSYPPLVVDRNNRDAYLNSLDKANEGDLAPLGRLFARLAMRSIRRELEEPAKQPVPRTARETARAFAQSIERQKFQEGMQKERAVLLRAGQIHGRIHDWFQETGKDLEEVFAEEGTDVWTWTDEATPEDSRSNWWRHQIIRTARRAEHFADLSNAWWSMLKVKVNGLQLRFVISIHHVGSRRTGVMAITTFGDIRIPDEEAATHEDAFVPTSSDAFTFTYDEDVEDRSMELYDWLDQSLAVALRELMRHTLGG